MNIQEMHSWFDVLQDKGDSPYFTVAEKTQFLNRAQMKFVNEVVQTHYNVAGAAPEGSAIPYSSVSSIQRGEEILQPLINELQTNSDYRKAKYPDTVTTAGATGPLGGDRQYTPSVNRYGQITGLQLKRYIRGMVKDVNDSYNTMSTWEKVNIMSIISMSWSQWPEIALRYVRRADVEKSLKNAFKKPTVEDPVFFMGLKSTAGVQYEIQPRTNPEGISFPDLYLGGTSGGYYHTRN